jgi:importin subunit alpha-1
VLKRNHGLKATPTPFLFLETPYNGQNQMAIFISEAEGLNKIEDLQQHSNNDIYEKCIKILETYFGVEEEEEMAALAPAMEGGTFGFGMDQGQQAPGTFDFSNSQ